VEPYIETRSRLPPSMRRNCETVTLLLFFQELVDIRQQTKEAWRLLFDLWGQRGKPMVTNWTT